MMISTSVSSYLWPGQTHFGFGVVEGLGREVKALQAATVFILTDPGVAAAGLLAPLTASLESARLNYVVYDQAEANPSTASVDAAAVAFRESGADVLVGIGGGSSLDTAKAVNLLAAGPAEASISDYSTRLPDNERRPYPSRAAMPFYIAIPTTAGTGAEVTPWALITDTVKQLKFGIGNCNTIPALVFVDPDLTLTLPPHLTAATGIDALTHLIEAYVSTLQAPILDQMILHGIELVGRSLRVAFTDGANRQARYDMLQASYIGGVAISTRFLGACHALAHPLSSVAYLHHGLACGLMLPYQMAYNLNESLENYAKIGWALSPANFPPDDVQTQAEYAIDAVKSLMLHLQLPTRLRDVGVDESLIPQLSKAAYADPNWATNASRIDEMVLEQLYRQAY